MSEYSLKELLTEKEWDAHKEFHEIMSEPMTTQELADKTQKLTELLKQIPTDSELNKRIEEQ